MRLEQAGPKPQWCDSGENCIGARSATDGGHMPAPRAK